MISINLLKLTPFPILLSKALGPLTNRLFGVSPYGVFTIVSGFLSGYPMGAKLVGELYTENKLSKSEAQYLLAFTNNSGPLFIVGTIGVGLLENKALGFFLLFINFVSALIIGIAQPKLKSRSIPINSSAAFNLGKALKYSINNGIEAIVLVGGYIIFFSMLCSIIHSLLLPLSLHANIKGLIFGILEITNGCKELTNINRLSLSLISGIIAFGGFSIHSQSLAYISSTNLSGKKYIFSKAIQGLLSFILCFCLYPLYAQQGCR